MMTSDQPTNEHRLREEVSALGWLLGNVIERLEGKIHLRACGTGTHRRA